MSNENLESKRWLIAIAAVVIQLCLGTVYAWSVFKTAIDGHAWLGRKDDAVTFMLLMLIIGLAAAFGGTLVDKKGPRFVATIGGILFGIGTLVAGYAAQMGNITVLYLGFGVIAALGNGFGYVTPIATLIRWFPDKRGLVTGLAVMGFGAGAFFMGKIAPAMIKASRCRSDEAGQRSSVRRCHDLVHLGRDFPCARYGRGPDVQEPATGMGACRVYPCQDMRFPPPIPSSSAKR